MTRSFIYQPSMTLLTDLYQLTMAYGYWKSGTHNKETVFNLFFRRHPFSGGYSLFCGLSQVIAFLDRFHFTEDDIAYLAGMTGNDEKPLFERAFLDALAQMRFSCDIHAPHEGTAMFPHEPMIRVRGPIIQCQLLETALLNMVNFQTLIATKAARIVGAARGDAVLEFGLRRAQGIDGSISASRAAYVGGCAGTSNVLAGKLMGIPVKGTHAHSWIMSFEDELTAFEQYARAMPNNCVFLVDTYDTLEGVSRAVTVGRALREQGHEMLGIRLDSGDLAHLSIEARRILDEGGFPNAVIVASNDLNEYTIEALKEKGARIAMWGVGTKLATAYEQPALGGVYKLSALRRPDSPWEYKVKLSEDRIKISNPGILNVRRYQTERGYVGDAIYDEEIGIPIRTGDVVRFDSDSGNRSPDLDGDATGEDLLQPIYRGGEKVYDEPDLEAIRDHASRQVSLLHEDVRLLHNPKPYSVGLEEGLHRLKEGLIAEARTR